MTSDPISPRDVSELIRLMQKDYSAAQLLNPDAAAAARQERDLLVGHVRGILDTLTPFLPGEVHYEVHIVDDVEVAETRSVADGRQLIFVAPHYIAFLRNLIDLLVAGIAINEDGAVRIPFAVQDEELKLFGNNLGEYIELGAPLTDSNFSRDGIAPEILVSAIEFIIGHEIMHRIETHSDDDDLSLTGFQDFCRRRGREYQCDRKSVGLLLLRRKNTRDPEFAFVGSIAALLALSWLEQFTPGWTPYADGHLYYPGSDSRVMRISFEEHLYWRAAEIEGTPRDLGGAVLRRAFRFLSNLEQSPKLIDSPMNALFRRCIADDRPDHERFQLMSGVLFAKGRTRRVASALGAMWGSAEIMAVEEENDPSLNPQGHHAMDIMERLHRRLVEAGGACSRVAEDMAAARDRHHETHA